MTDVVVSCSSVNSNILMSVFMCKLKKCRNFRSAGSSEEQFQLLCIASVYRKASVSDIQHRGSGVLDPCVQLYLPSAGSAQTLIPSLHSNLKSVSRHTIFTARVSLALRHPAPAISVQVWLAHNGAVFTFASEFWFGFVAHFAWYGSKMTQFWMCDLLNRNTFSYKWIIKCSNRWHRGLLY